ncbi:hypothetical protein K493DRAFT_296951 [Basidiobolus meristosporus CBS 931.73]|uniref:Uncharacterized protein n=1 Tax=Basidiobolus meristosporus CBS 931.73 TaxID=1314790 RepID=A0A1Y1Z2I9_9FUNG|nr:hypothetical protein K493DRAFT_296951 [Basidiobolus meristosporus CBS 931.73]|eukprot:ORY04510.1 hypothetical protein K493DRAFT_296951 [Basidiobolus meristosporus CBS 931.73]
MTRKTNFNSVLTKFLYETFPGDKSKQKERFKLDPVFENRDYNHQAYLEEPADYWASSEITPRHEQQMLSRSSTFPQPPTVRDSNHGKKRYSIDSKLEDPGFLQVSSASSQCLENYLNQIIYLEKDKRQLVLERKTWKKRCVRAETEQVTQALEFKGWTGFTHAIHQNVAKLKVRYDSDLAKLRLLHQQRCESLISEVNLLTQVSETYRNQLLDHGIEPRLVSCEDTLDEDRRYIEERYRKLKSEPRQVLDDELDHTVEKLFQALTYELGNYSTNANHGQKFDLAASI